MTISSLVARLTGPGRSRLAGSVPFVDRDALREGADLAAIRDARPVQQNDDSRRTSVRNERRFAMKYAASEC